MRTIIAGSRDIEDYDLLLRVVQEVPWPITTVLSGTARGVDRLGEIYGLEHNVPVEKYPADWNKYGRYVAGKVRNVEMATKAEALIALWNGHSGGTGHMIDTARKYKLIVHVELV